ncbi:hypothetical protein L596_022247 [Steinernema carpocapsae]|uniref:C2H2-type domain-containing protein n=1 Tax=Steinernema carpocapsae TaxID=34508 RepID=A0A4V6A058_STECR|nr:hypothetical protein L596_022247 [Steinernema carpocapsae]
MPSVLSDLRERPPGWNDTSPTSMRPPATNVSSVETPSSSTTTSLPTIVVPVPIRGLFYSDVRENMESNALRRLVNNLASRDIRLDPPVVPVPKLPPVKLEAPAEPLKPLPIHVQQANLLSPRADLTNGRPCPICSVFFYGNMVLERHMKVVHPREFEDWAVKHCDGYQPVKNAVGVRFQEARASQDLQEAAQDSEEEEIGTASDA